MFTRLPSVALWSLHVHMVLSSLSRISLSASRRGSKEPPAGGRGPGPSNGGGGAAAKKRRRADEDPPVGGRGSGSEPATTGLSNADVREVMRAAERAAGVQPASVRLRHPLTFGARLRGRQLRRVRWGRSRLNVPPTTTFHATYARSWPLQYLMCS